MTREQKHAPEVTDVVTLDDVELSVTYKVNYDRPRDEQPEVYDVHVSLAPSAWIQRAVEEELVNRVWEAEIRAAAERHADRMDGPEYDPDEQRAVR
jgi:hypothetical protein